jgi:hypothetical protein
MLGETDHRKSSEDFSEPIRFPRIEPRPSASNKSPPWKDDTTVQQHGSEKRRDGENSREEEGAR